MNSEEVYSIPVRVYGKNDIMLVKDLKKEFNSNSLNKCIVQVIQEYYRMKKKLANIEMILKKSVKVKYEISKDAYEILL